MKKYKYLFGPLISRRFGRSLGVDLCPIKTCRYDCIFCQLARTTEKTIKREEFFPLEKICDEVSHWLKTDGHAEYITLAGSGEPTLYSRFGELIDFIYSKTDIPVLILSNGSLFWQPEVREAAAKADVVKLSMSAWNQNLFDNINRPDSAITFERMIEGKIAFRKEYKGKLILEVFLLAGINAIQADVLKIAEFANKIRPSTIHLNTVTRPAAEDFAYSVNQKKMEEFAKLFTPEAEIPTEVSGNPLLGKNIDEDKILDIIRRRPLTLDQLANTFGVLHPNEIAKITGKLLRNDKIKINRQNNENYFKIK
jgi:wyosine [tRNA(Phe)-imidazoG37] synthetase (radical SAM superfamily)